MQKFLCLKDFAKKYSFSVFPICLLIVSPLLFIVFIQEIVKIWICLWQHASIRCLILWIKLVVRMRTWHNLTVLVSNEGSLLILLRSWYLLYLLLLVRGLDDWFTSHNSIMLCFVLRSHDSLTWNRMVKSRWYTFPTFWFSRFFLRLALCTWLSLLELLIKEHHIIIDESLLVRVETSPTSCWWVKRHVSSWIHLLISLLPRMMLRVVDVRLLLSLLWLNLLLLLII